MTKKDKLIITKFFNLVKEQKYWLFLGTVLTIVSSACFIVLMIYMRIVLDFAVEHNLSGFYNAIIIMGVISLLLMLLSFLQTLAIGKYAETSVYNLREKILSKVQRLSVASLNSEHSGDTLSRMTNDVNQVRNYFLNHFHSWITMPLMAIAGLIYMVWVDWGMTLFTTLLIPLFGIIGNAVGGLIKKDSEKLQKTVGSLTAMTQDAISGSEINKAFTMENSYSALYKLKVKESVKLAKKMAIKKIAINIVSFLIQTIPFLMCVLYGGYLMITGKATTGQVLVFVNFLNFVLRPMSALPTLIGESNATSAALDRINNLLSLEEERSNGKCFDTNNENIIEFKNISFGYNSEYVINNISIAVKRGEKIAIVGSSGCGKSTILKLIAGFYEQNTGEINYFGHNKNDWNLKDLRKNMAFVTQDTFLFPGTIFENIAYGKKNTTKEEVIDAAIIANAHEFILTLPHGYHTQIGELGAKLSGGQKQRISIARSVLKNPEIILLDEATSALDTESEKLFQRALERICENKTTITVAHRLSTIQGASRILVMNKGEVVEEGNHTELMLKNGMYSKLYNISCSLEQNNTVSV